MVWMTMMAECRAERHQDCPGTLSAAPGEFGGVICECRCHVKSRSFEERPASMQEVEFEFWRVIKDGDDLEDFELYLSQFPDGPHAGLAREKIAKLKKT